MIDVQALRKAYLDNEAALHRILKRPPVEDYRLCVTMAAEQVGCDERAALSALVTEMPNLEAK